MNIWFEASSIKKAAKLSDGIVEQASVVEKYRHLLQTNGVLTFKCGRKDCQVCCQKIVMMLGRGVKRFDAQVANYYTSSAMSQKRYDFAE